MEVLYATCRFLSTNLWVLFHHPSAVDFEHAKGLVVWLTILSALLICGPSLHSGTEGREGGSKGREHL